VNDRGHDLDLNQNRKAGARAELVYSAARLIQNLMPVSPLVRASCVISRHMQLRGADCAAACLCQVLQHHQRGQLMLYPRRAGGGACA